MKHKTIYILMLLSLLLVSCTENKIIEAEPQIVVEGWIDAGGYPVVMLSQILPVTEHVVTDEDIRDCIIAMGKVTISDGERSIVLTGKKSDKYFPPYIYTTSKMRGEEGKTYYLTAEYKDFYATAQTTIPPKAKIEKIITHKENGSYSISAVINDNPEEKNYYKFFVQLVGRDNCYLSSNFAIIDDKNYTFPCTVPIDLGRSSFNGKDTNKHIMSEKDILMIKVAQIDYAMYNFWDDYKNITELGINPFFRYSNSIRSNISGGSGYWAGYGATEYLLQPYNHEKPIELKK